MRETTVFGDAPWYRERSETEVRWEGTLAPHPRALGPGSRGGLDYVLRGAESEDPVYLAGAEDRVVAFLGRGVVIWGKRVWVDGAQELWPGRIAQT